MYEFFAEPTGGQSGAQEEFNNFSKFLTLCSESPSTAMEMLSSSDLDRTSSVALVTRFGKEIRRLQTDLSQQREQRILSIRHSLEDQLLEAGIDLRSILGSQLDAVIEDLVPNPFAPETLALLAAPWVAPTTAAVFTVNINPQIINALESTVIQNIEGTVNLGASAKDLLELIGRYGGQDIATLQSAVHELEDPDAPLADRAMAKHRLKKFVRQVGEKVQDIGLDLLEKYLESKLGL